VAQVSKRHKANSPKSINVTSNSLPVLSIRLGSNPKNNDLVKVNTSQASTATYYKYAAVIREWNYMALYSTYQEKYQNKLLGGTISLAEGSVAHDIYVSYKYITAN
jgi:hypothetical protein